MHVYNKNTKENVGGGPDSHDERFYLQALCTAGQGDHGNDCDE